MVDDQIRTPGEDDDSGYNRGQAVTIGIAAVVVFILILMGIGAIYTQAAGKPAPNTCSTSCLVFVKTECPGNRRMDQCLGYWLCEPPTHTCGADP